MRCFVLLLCCAQALCAAVDLRPRVDTLSPLVQLLATNSDAAFQLDILKGISDGLKGRRHVTMPAGWDDLALKLQESTNSQVRSLAQSLSVVFGSERALATLRKTLLSSEASLAARTNAVATLLAAKDPNLVPALLQMLAEPTLRATALRGLPSYDDERIPAAILSLYPVLPLTERNLALSTLSSRLTFARPLLQAVADQKIPARDLTADIVRQLETLNNAGIDERVAKVWGVTHETQADKRNEIARLKSVIQSKGFGDAARGRAVFTKICQQCHSLFNEGGKVGPDLTGANRTDLDYLLQNIIDPNALIPNDYRTWNVETKDDRSITGIVTRQDDKTVTIVTATESMVIPRKEVQSMSQSELSLMPEGLLQPLTESEVRDLLSYLRSSSQVATAEPK